jgi:hypothetical protein
MGNLRHDSCAITGSGVRTHRPTVLEVSEGVESDINNVVTRVPAHGGYQCKPARVLVERRIKESRSCGHSGEAMVWTRKIHDTSPKK